MGAEPRRAEDARLLEREGELAALTRRLDEVTEAGGLIVLEGTAGIGKTSLLAAAARIADRRGVFVRTARGGPLEREMPFGIAAQLFEPVLERAAEEERSRLLSGSAQLASIALPRQGKPRNPEGEDPFAPIHGLFWLVANLADERPCVLLVDDLQWADSESLRWILYLARRLDDVTALVIATVRSGEPDEPDELEALRDEAEILRPESLSLDAVETLIADAFAEYPDREFSEACLEATGGNPFLVAEVLRALKADSAGPTAAAARTIVDARHENVARHVLIRLGRFGPQAVALAEAVATLGPSTQLTQIARLAGIPEEDARRLVDRLRDAEILTPGRPIEFVHPLVRAAVYEQQSAERRAGSHRRAAREMDRDGAPPGAIAPHLLASAPARDQWVVARLADAADEALAAGAPAAATTFLERALAEPADDPQPLRFKLGRALRATEPFRAPTVIADVAREAEDPDLRSRAIRQAAFANFDIGNIGEAVDWTHQLVDAVPPGDSEGRLNSVAQLVCTRILANGRDAPVIDMVDRMGVDVGRETRGELNLRQAVAFSRAVAGDPADEIFDLVVPTPKPPWGIEERAPFFGVLTLSFLGGWESARTALEEQLAGERQGGRLPGVAYCYGFLSHVERCAGNLDEAENLGRRGRDIAVELAPLSYPAFLGGFNLVAALIVKGDLDRAQAIASDLPLALGYRELPTIPIPRNLQGALRVASGELEAGVEDLLAVRAEIEDLNVPNPVVEPWCLMAVPALAALDRTAEGRDLVVSLERHARRFGAAHGIGIVLRSRALIEPRKRSIETLRESVTALEEYGPRHELASSLLELGAALRRDGHRSDSREPLRRALDLAHRSGATGLEDRAREELAAAGSRPRRAVRTGVAALTPSELRTAKLAAEGLANVEIAQRLFVTRKTVEKHLGNAYSKLEISGREHLAQALAE